MVIQVTFAKDNGLALHPIFFDKQGFDKVMSSDSSGAGNEKGLRKNLKDAKELVRLNMLLPTDFSSVCSHCCLLC